MMKLFLAILFTMSGVNTPQRGASQTPASVKLYVFDCGTLKSGNPGVLLERGVTTTDMSVAAYLIVHPRGTLLWDTGVIPDELIQPGGTTEARATVHKTLKGQLAEIEYKPSDITYLALSHNHYDHSANSNSFAGSTWLVQKAERAAMFPDTPPSTPSNAAVRFSALKSSKTTLLDGDYDVFGDGSVVIKSAPGHSPDHQVLFVNLSNTGPVVLSGDLYHYPEERALRKIPTTEFNREQSAASRAAIEAFLMRTHAQLWIEHDFNANAKLKKSPAYYD